MLGGAFFEPMSDLGEYGRLHCSSGESLDFVGHYDPGVEDARLIGASLFLHGGSSRPPVI
jgi:hypothetical protein